MGTIGNIANAAAGANTGANSTNQLSSLAGNFNTFLTLLTTQLKNQDPTNPVDSNAFTQQLVEFAGVQQQVQTNTLLQQLVSNSTVSQVSSATSFIGTNVKATGNQGAVVNGAARFGYTLDYAAHNAKVTIKDAAGNVVFIGNGSVNAGDNVVTWDGKNSYTGAQEPDGVYTIGVEATDANGNTIKSTPFTTGTVTSASIANGTIVLNIGALQIPESSVSSITNLPGTQQQTTASN